MFRAFSIPLTWTELVKRTIHETSQDNVLGLAAQLAYYFLLALVPAIVSVAALASFLPGDTMQRALDASAGVLPAEMVRIVREQLQNVSGGGNGGVFTFGLLMALWSSSAAIVSICDALNRAYDIEEGRPWWKVRLTAIALTLGTALFAVTAFALVMIGPTLAERLASQWGLGPAVATAWKVVQWPVAFGLIAFGIALLNYFGPDAEQDWEWITPGALLATALWLMASVGFKFYVTRVSDYNNTYGSLGGVIVLMLWLYITGIAILVGAEMNAEIEHASPYGKDPGEKVPGEKKKLGAAAARAHQEWPMRMREVMPTSPDALPQTRRRIATATVIGAIALQVFQTLWQRGRTANRDRANAKH